jgi:pimeloyl-ACP methyl ester carboxylesterase
VAQRVDGVPYAPQLPLGERLRLPGRGTTFIRRIDGPPGAPVLFLLHGWTASADLNWFPAYEALGRRFSVVAMDHRGHGRGIRSWRPFRLEDCADDVAAVCRALGLDHIIPVGYSMGGPIAQLTWRRHRHLVDGLVLCATSRSFARRTAASRTLFASLMGLSLAARLTPPAVRRTVTDRVVGDRVVGMPVAEWGVRELRRGDPATILQAGTAIGGFRSHEWIGGVDVPTAVVVTTRDQLVAPARQLSLARAIPGATVHAVHGDHGVCVSDPRTFVPALVQACTDVATRIPR